jgi:hypothetical protein
MHAFEEMCFSQLTNRYALAGLLRHPKPHCIQGSQEITILEVWVHHHPSPMKEKAFDWEICRGDWCQFANKVCVCQCQRKAPMTGALCVSRSPLAPSPFLLPLQYLFHLKTLAMLPLLPTSPHVSWCAFNNRHSFIGWSSRMGRPAASTSTESWT